jgi:hypothetical protein
MKLGRLGTFLAVAGAAGAAGAIAYYVTGGAKTAAASTGTTPGKNTGVGPIHYTPQPCTGAALAPGALSTVTLSVASADSSTFCVPNGGVVKSVVQNDQNVAVQSSFVGSAVTFTAPATQPSGSLMPQTTFTVTYSQPNGPDTSSTVQVTLSA